MEDYKYVLESLSDMEKKYYDSLNMDEKATFVIKKGEELEQMNELGVLGTSALFLAAAPAVGAIMNAAQKEKEEGSQPKPQQTEIPPEESLGCGEDSKEETPKEKEPTILNQEQRNILKSVFSDEKMHDIERNLDNGLALTFISNVDDEDYKYLCKLLRNTTITPEEATKINKFFTSKGIDFPDSENLADLNDLSGIRKGTKSFDTIVGGLERFAKTCRTNIENAETENIFEKKIKGDGSLDEGLFEPINAAFDMAGNLGSMPFKAINGMANYGYNALSKGATKLANKVGNKISQGIENIPNARQQRKDKKAAKKQAKIDARNQADIERYGPIIELENLIKNANTLEDIYSKMPEIDKKLYAFFAKKGATYPEANEFIKRPQSKGKKAMNLEILKAEQEFVKKLPKDSQIENLEGLLAIAQAKVDANGTTNNKVAQNTEETSGNSANGEEASSQSSNSTVAPQGSKLSPEEVTKKVNDYCKEKNLNQTSTFELLKNLGVQYKPLGESELEAILDSIQG